MSMKKEDNGGKKIAALDRDHGGAGDGSGGSWLSRFKQKVTKLTRKLYEYILDYIRPIVINRYILCLLDAWASVEYTL
jgi:hypothetical protein